MSLQIVGPGCDDRPVHRCEQPLGVSHCVGALDDCSRDPRWLGQQASAIRRVSTVAFAPGIEVRIDLRVGASWSRRLGDHRPARSTASGSTNDHLPLTCEELPSTCEELPPRCDCFAHRAHGVRPAPPPHLGVQHSSSADVLVRIDPWGVLYPAAIRRLALLGPCRDLGCIVAGLRVLSGLVRG